ncbi:hypothetical protein HanPI659440_Chr13g0511691 [Helianthus annuus]|nr:hypothetical protein HanPI659440_Chr13g0511691 [Helianthus annuus]
MFTARTKITNLEAEVSSLKEKIKETKPDRECAEILRKDRDLAGKDAEIAELKRRLFEVHEKNESLEIDLAAEKVKADTTQEAHKAAEEAHQISTSALNVMQTNYSEAQSMVDTHISESEWMRNRGVVVVANSILNETELDQEVVALTVAARAVGRRGGYLKYAQHVKETLHQHFRTRHCFVTDQADEMLARAEEVYDNLSLPVMDLVIEALKYDDYVARLKSILIVLEIVELSDEEETTGEGDGE